MEYVDPGPAASRLAPVLAPPPWRAHGRQHSQKSRPDKLPTELSLCLDWTQPFQIHRLHLHGPGVTSGHTQVYLCPPSLGSGSGGSDGRIEQKRGRKIQARLKWSLYRKYMKLQL